MEGLKKCFKDWTLFEKLWLSIFTVVNIYLFFAFKDTVIGLTASLTGMLCVVLCAKGKISNLYFGIVNTVLYAYVALGQKYYGEVMLNVLYYLPTQFIAIYLWNRNKSTNSEGIGDIKAEIMTNKSRLLFSTLAIVLILVYGYFLVKIGGGRPYIDATSTILSVFAQYLMMKRYVEQWVLWIIIDIFTIALWLFAFLSNSGNISMLVMWSAFLVNAIYGLINWTKIYKSSRG